MIVPIWPFVMRRPSIFSPSALVTSLYWMRSPTASRRVSTAEASALNRFGSKVASLPVLRRTVTRLRAPSTETTRASEPLAMPYTFDSPRNFTWSPGA